MGLISSSPNQQTEEIACAPCQVSFKEVIRSLHGSLFPDTGLQRVRSPAQNQLLDSLLESVVCQEGGRGREKSTGKVYVDPRMPAGDRLWQSSTSDDCMACSVSSDSTISRTNSWTSSTSDASSSTCITSAASSPSLSKIHLPPLVDDKIFRQRLSHSCRAHRKSRRIAIALHESPLATSRVSFESKVLRKHHAAHRASIKSRSSNLRS